MVMIKNPVVIPLAITTSARATSGACKITNRTTRLELRIDKAIKELIKLLANTAKKAANRIKSNNK
jgi:flagellar biosynthesis/type III secretory pathway protein FliH